MYSFKNKYSVIACANSIGYIGKDNNLIYRIKGDLKNFNTLTTGNVVIMGRKTFESLPNSLPLKNRINIVITSKEDYHINTETPELFENTFVCSSLEEVDQLCYAYFQDKELFIIGGGVVYETAFNLGIVDKVIMTLVNDDTEGDVKFYDIQNDDNYRVIFKTTSLRDQANDIYYYYVVYKRNNG